MHPLADDSASSPGADVFSPLTVIVVGEDHGVVVRRLRAARPDAVVTGLGPVDAATVAHASATAHLVLGIGEVSAVAWCDAVLAEGDEDGLSRFLARAAEVEERRRARRLPPDTPPILESWSPHWAADAARLGARVAAAFDGVPVRVDHIGSTAVPGLRAKPIIDLQVGVRDLADADAAEQRLGDAGFVNVQRIVPDAPGVSRDNARTSGDQGEWSKRLFASVDAGARAIVHVRRVGASNARYALLFRDWLRADPGARDEYAVLKTALASAHRDDRDFDDYARAKDHWFDRAQREMEAWARATGWVPGGRGA
ncbi:GrpB family protein [Microbacterium sp. CH1]|uniref:GrpB family protein n=1 Tax=Microbacterium sp. CH1 TaxID=1770208 RepID=UPI000B03D21B|nr:GrpB family protein [Microbacterium sp. CH1]